MVVRERAPGFFVSGGTLPLLSQSYIERDSDEAMYRSLRAGRYCYVLNSRQMGKSSLSVRVLARLEQEGIRTACIDLTQMGGRNVSPEQWYTGLAAEMGRAFGLRAEVLAFCRGVGDYAPMHRFFGSLREVVLARTEGQLVLCIDEIDATRNLSFDADEFFAGIRHCFNQRVRDEAFGRLTICMLGVAIPGDLIRNPTTTPFNIGDRVFLRDFSTDEVRRFAVPLGGPGHAIVGRVHYWTNGHPYLTQSLCAECLASSDVREPRDVDRLVDRTLFTPKARDRNINLADTANRALNAGTDESDPEAFRADLLSMYSRVLKGKFVADDESNRVASLLKLSGLVTGDGHRLLPRNRIYRRVFDENWIRENMPAQELFRQRQSYRRGLLRAFGLSASAIALFGVLTIWAWRAEYSSARARADLSRELYVADMNNLRSLEEDGDVARASEVLRRNEKSRFRGFEWVYWMRRLHDSREEFTLDYEAPGKRESGILSWDGSQLCVVDDLTHTASLVDRRSRERLAQVGIRESVDIVASPEGFLTLDSSGPGVTAFPLFTTGPIRELGHEISGSSHVVVSSHSKAVAIIHDFYPPDTLREFSVWSLSDGKELLSRRAPSKAFKTPLALSSDGKRVILGPPLGPLGVRLSHAFEVVETKSNQVIDRFDVPDRGNFVAMSDDGNHVLYTDAASTLLGRDIGRHCIVYRQPDAGREGLSSAAFVDGSSLVAIKNVSGATDIERYPSGQPVAEYQNVWSLNSAPQGSEIVAGSTSVRILDLRPGVGSGILAPGDRLGRDGRGHIVDLAPKRAGGVLYADPSIHAVAHIAAPTQPHSYTYNGLWRMVNDPASGTAEFNAADGTGKPIRIRPIPTNFSAGLGRAIFVTFDSHRREASGWSGESGAKLWTYPLGVSESNGIWMSPDGSRVFLFVRSTSLLVLDGRTGREVATLTPHNLRLANIAFSADNRRFLTFGYDGRTVLWELATLRPVVEFRGNGAQRVSGGDISPDGSRVVTTTEGGLLQIWDVATGVQLSSVRASAGRLRGALFTADGKSLVTVAQGDTVRAWTSLDRDPSIRLAVPASALNHIQK